MCVIETDAFVNFMTLYVVYFYVISCKPRSTVVHVKIPQSSNLGCFQSLVRGHGSRLPPSPPLLSSLGGGGHRPALLRTEKPAQERHPGINKTQVNIYTFPKCQ